MITVLVQFILPQPISHAQAIQAFSASAPRYREVQGLIRKQYILAEDGQTAGGVYLWQSREDADRFYTEDWHAFIFEKYASPPSLSYFGSPVIVDNALGAILVED